MNAGSGAVHRLPAPPDIVEAAARRPDPEPQRAASGSPSAPQ